MLWFGMPRLYVDVTDTWRVSERRVRVEVALAGAQAQLAAAGILACLLLWTAVSREGHALVPTYLLLLNLATVLGNLIPFGGSDGYWALSTLLDRPSLRQEWQTALQGFVDGSIPANRLLRSFVPALLAVGDAAFPRVIAASVLAAIFPLIEVRTYLAWVWLALGGLFAWWSIGQPLLHIACSRARLLRRVACLLIFTGAMYALALWPVSTTTAVQLEPSSASEHSLPPGLRLSDGSYRVLVPGTGLLGRPQLIATTTMTAGGGTLVFSGQVPAANTTVLLIREPRPLWFATVERITSAVRLARKGTPEWSS